MESNLDKLVQETDQALQDGVPGQQELQGAVEEAKRMYQRGETFTVALEA